MIADTSAPAPVEYPRLILHAGGRDVTFAEVERVPTPEATRTWHPVAHATVVQQTRVALRNAGFQIMNEAHALAREDARYFGIMAVKAINSGEKQHPYDLVLGLRSSHDKSYPITLGAGSRVFVCDNLAFSAEVRMKRKHTVHAARDLPKLLTDGMGKLVHHWNSQDTRFTAYQEREIDDVRAHDFMIRAVRSGALPPSRIHDVVKEWHEPAHKEFEVRNCWSLFNAFTEGMKGDNISLVAQRTMRLHTLMDAECELVTQA